MHKKKYFSFKQSPRFPFQIFSLFDAPRFNPIKTGVKAERVIILEVCQLNIKVGWGTSTTDHNCNRERWNSMGSIIS